MAIHSDNLEKMRVELQQAQSKNQEFAVSQLAIQITQEEEKRRRWAVSLYRVLCFQYYSLFILLWC